MSQEIEKAETTENPCPICGSDRLDLEAKCDACHWQPLAARTAPLEHVKVTVAMLFQAVSTVSIASLFLITALVAVCAAIATVDLVTGIFVGVTGSIAFARTALHALYAKAEQRPLTASQKATSFIASFVFVLSVLAVSVITFMITCGAGLSSSGSIAVALGLGAICAVAMCLFMLWNVPVHPKQDA